MDTVINDLIDFFMDAVFELKSFLPKEDYIQAVAEKAPWIFNAKHVRARVYEQIDK
jgi:hypothetical protein